MTQDGPHPPIPPPAPGAPCILVVDDSPDARAMARRALERDGFAVTEAGDGAGALAAVADGQSDLVLLDLQMPGMGGLEVLTQLRRGGNDVPVMVLSGRAEESERVLALELGADDYVVKPFLVRELPARIRSVLRRCRPPAPSHLTFGPLQIRPVERELLLAGEVIDLTTREFDLLAHLAANPRRAFSRGELLKEVWESSKDWQDPATVTEHVRRIRRKIEDDPENPRWITTVRGVGYRFEP